MKQKRLKRKTVSLLLAAAMILTSFPVSGKEARAASDHSLSVTAFATKEQLMDETFAPDENGSSSTIGKLAFGKNSKGAAQEWYILGKDTGVDGDNTVLFAAGPIATRKEEYASNVSKSYDSNWNCNYTDGAPSQVDPNHYGGSGIRAKLNAIAGNVQYFTTAEQGLMKETTVKTRDTKANKDYTTTDKLYALTAEDNATTIKAGTEDQIELAMSTYWKSGGTFWLRAPGGSLGRSALAAVPGDSVDFYGVFAEYALVPACNLNLSSVIFASAVEAASSENIETGSIEDGTAMTLRLDGSDKSIGTVVYDETAGKIAAQKGADAAGTVSLVVQGNDGSNDWYYSVQAGETMVITKEQIQDACGISGDISLADCKIWLETTIDNVAYATMAEATNLNAEVILNPGETALREDETISNSTDGTVTVDKGYDGTVDTTIKLPTAGNIHITENGRITVPAGGTVQSGDGKELTLPNGGTVDTDGNVEADKIKNGETTVTAPEGGKLAADKDGKITVPIGGTVQTGEGKELTLPDGGSVDEDGKVETDKIVSGDTTVTAPAGGKVTADKDGKITVPIGGTVKAGDGKELTLPNGGSVDEDGNVEADKIKNGETTVTAPEGGNVTTDKDGNITVPAGGKVQTGEGKELTLPDGGSVDKDGKVEADKIVSGDITVTAPAGGKVTADKDGKITVPAGGTVKTGDGKELTLPEGGSVDEDGKVEADKIVSGDTTVTAPAGGNVTVDKDGNIIVPAGGTVKTGDGKELTLPNGGTVDKDGTVSANQTQPTEKPTNPPTGTPTNPPTGAPTNPPTGTPTNPPTGTPTNPPTGTPTNPPTGTPTNPPTGTPTNPPTGAPTNPPTGAPTNPPTGTPTNPPTGTPTNPPTGTPTNPPTGAPTNPPTGTPTNPPTGTPTSPPTGTPTNPPTGTPTNSPTGTPTNPPTGTPTNLPTGTPTEKPTEETPIPYSTVPPEEVVKNSEKLDFGVTAKWKGNAFTLGWQAVRGAEGYDIFAAQCGKKLGEKSLIRTVKGEKTSVSFAKIAGKKLSEKKNYKVKIKAWKYIDGKKVYIGSSKTYNVAGGKNKKYTNARKLSPAKKKYTLKKGKSVSLKVRIVKQSKKKNLLPKSYGPALRYLSDNKEVATVTSKGKVKAKGEGTCYIYVTALNGISVKIKVTVK